jgi:tetratricopeptide (TPR) repeat protein
MLWRTLDVWLQKSPQSLTDRGNAYADRREYDLAISDYSQAIKINPDCVDAYMGRGGAYAAKGLQDLAIADYSTAIRVVNSHGIRAFYRFPPRALILTARGNRYCEKKDYVRAIADFDKAVQSDLHWSPGFIGRGRAHYAIKEYERALSDFEAAIQADPAAAASINKWRAEVFASRGFARANRGDHDLAIADYDEAIRLDPALALAVEMRAAAIASKNAVAARRPSHT